MSQTAESEASPRVDARQESRTQSAANQGAESQSPDDDDQSNGPSYKEVLLGAATVAIGLLAGWGLRKLLKKNDPEPAKSDDDEEGSGLGGVLSTLEISDQNECDEPIDSSNIGSRFNQWRKPVADYGNNPADWEVKLKASPFVGDIEFSRKDWSRARAAVDAVLELLMKEIKNIAATYEGIKIERYVRQGSSREGLKVVAPDEFDTILQFHFEELSFQAVEISKGGLPVPEFCFLDIKQSMDTLQRRLPKLFRGRAFCQDGDQVRLNARRMHEIFESIIDKARENVMEKVRSEASKSGQLFKLTRKMNPPSINITIHLDDEVNTFFMRQGAIPNPHSSTREIDLDIVPGLLIRTDVVPDPAYPGQTIDCPVYAVFKWMEETRSGASDFKKPALIWRISSSGLEKHTLDMVTKKTTQLYIITAMRVLKTYFVKTKKASSTPPQIATVLKSYHLKHLAFYLILYLCYIRTDAKIYGIKDALKYFFAFLRESLTKGSLPHFFHSNSLVTRMYPTYKPRPVQLRFNLLRNKSKEALNQALLSLDNHLIPNLGFSLGAGDPKVESVKQEYSHGISVGSFF